MYKIGDRVRIIENGKEGIVVTVFEGSIPGSIVELDEDWDGDSLFDCHDYEVELADNG